MNKQDGKDFNAMLKNDKDMPKVKIVRDKNIIEKYGGRRMLIAPPSAYDELMKVVPYGKLITTKQMRDHLAKKYDADFTDPMTAAVFVNIAAWASYQRKEDITPFWRTIKSDGQLIDIFPEAIMLQKKALEEEGHTIIVKGTKILKYYVEDYQKSLIKL